jgi:hypothetical protein
MAQTRVIEPRYLSFYAAGSLSVEIPLSMEGLGIVASRECVNIPAIYWNDGSTTVTLGDFGEIAKSGAPDFDGFVSTPSRELILFDAEMPEIMRAAVPSRDTRLRIWMNHPTQPDDVVIAIGDG